MHVHAWMSPPSAPVTFWMRSYKTATTTATLKVYLLLLLAPPCTPPLSSEIDPHFKCDRHPTTLAHPCRRTHAGVVPKLEIVLTPSPRCQRQRGTTKTGAEPVDVWVFNNESGFTARDVEAICDVCNSTKAACSAERDRGRGEGGAGVAERGGGDAGSKAKNERGRIGRKGIGFKSVFMVSNAPHIFSGPFSFKFDR